MRSRSSAPCSARRATPYATRSSSPNAEHSAAQNASSETTPSVMWPSRQANVPYAGNDTPGSSADAKSPPISGPAQLSRTSAMLTSMRVPVPVRLRPGQRRADGHGRVGAACEIADGDAAACDFGGACRQETRPCLVVQIVPGRGSESTVLAVAADGAMDDRRVGRTRGVVADAKSIRDARPKAFDDHIGIADELARRGPSRIIFQVVLEDRLARVQRFVQGGEHAHRIAAGRLHLGDLSTELGEQLCCERHRSPDPEVEHANLVQQVDSRARARHGASLAHITVRICTG